MADLTRNNENPAAAPQEMDTVLVEATDVLAAQTALPTAAPTLQPTEVVTPAPTLQPTEVVTPAPTLQPTEVVTPAPTPQPTAEVTAAPSPTPAPVRTMDSVTIGIITAAAVIAVLTIVLLLLRKKPDKKKNVKKKGKSTGTHVIEPAANVAAGNNTPSILVGMAQTVGARKNQQDALYCSRQEPRVVAERGFVAAVADGIGGLQDGQMASQAAMQTFQICFNEDRVDRPPVDRLLAMAVEAQNEVVQMNDTLGKRSGATLVSVLISGWKMAYLSIGDSRICLYRAGGLLQLNREHILRREVEEREAMGKYVEPGGRLDGITSYLGKDNLTLIDRALTPMRLVPGDKIVLMSDGVFGTLEDSELIRLLRSDPQMAADEIIKRIDAIGKPHQDNASVLVVGIQ